jgi:hypothetical protein
MRQTKTSRNGLPVDNMGKPVNITGIETGKPAYVAKKHPKMMVLF